MSNKSALTFAVMDPPYESSRTATFFGFSTSLRVADTTIRVFAYEGAAALAFEQQRPHGNAVHKHSVEEENHPLPKNWVTAIQVGSRTKWWSAGVG